MALRNMWVEQRPKATFSTWMKHGCYHLGDITATNYTVIVFETWGWIYDIRLHTVILQSLSPLNTFAYYQGLLACVFVLLVCVVRAFDCQSVLCLGHLGRLTVVFC